MKIKKIVMSLICMLAIAAIAFGINVHVQASANSSDPTISNGVYIEGINVSGMTKEEAENAVNSYVDELKAKEITFVIDTNNVAVSADELGMNVTNLDVVEEAVNLGKTGNIIQRYKALKDLERENKEYVLEIAFDDAAIESVINEKCLAFDVEPVEASLKREKGKFVVTAGQTGLGVDVSASAKLVKEDLAAWNKEDTSIELSVELVQPKATTEDFEKVTDVLGTFTTSYSTSGTARSANVENGARLVNGTVLFPGETFSTVSTIAPFSEENGYYLAGSYLQGQVVDSLGGGICQVSTTLYNAVLLAELQVEERHNHSMIVGYVDPSADAAIAESAGKDFKFTNTTNAPLYIESATSGKQITFTIYGDEERPSNRTIKYVSETLSTTEPTGAKYALDATLLFGQQKQTQSAHIGYKAKLHKHVYVDGKETEVTEVNSSSYKAEPAYISVGTAWGDEGSIGVLAAAVATNDPATVTATIDSLAGIVNQAAALSAQAEAQAAAEAAAAAAGQ
ncbi:VanW family protein [Konateibacter massiliensis]|uniref:VanW family protein n=1 Tax=Konateibacter massiliensis TaxID=2002841 RepID=UPI000C155AF0|nr:VanW family protein [Konateibacter massiliensis]